jgi:hypothetical protein
LDIIENARKYDFFSNKYIKVIDVSCGVNHIAVVVMSKNEGGEEAAHVYTWGLPTSGSLGYVEDIRKFLYIIYIIIQRMRWNIKEILIN